MPLWERIKRWGATPFVHSYAEVPGLVEVHPAMRLSGESAVAMAEVTNRLLVFDTMHAVRGLRPGDLKPGESLDSKLGDWRLWMGVAVATNRLGLFDFHPTPTQLAKGELDEPLSMLRFALNRGYKGPIRVEAVLPRLVDQAVHWRIVAHRMLNLVHNELES